MDNLQS